MLKKLFLLNLFAFSLFTTNIKAIPAFLSKIATKKVIFTGSAVMAAATIGTVKLYQNGYFNWLSRIVYKKKYDQLAQIKKNCITDHSFAFVYWRYFANHQGFFISPESIIVNSSNVLKLIAFDFDHMVLRDHQINTHDFTKHLTAIDRELKSLQESMNELSDFISKTDFMESYNQVDLLDLNKEKLSIIEKDFFEDLYLNDNYSLYSLAKRYYFKLWKLHKRLCAIRSIIKDAPILDI